MTSSLDKPDPEMRTTDKNTTTEGVNPQQDQVNGSTDKPDELMELLKEIRTQLDYTDRNAAGWGSYVKRVVDRAIAAASTASAVQFIQPEARKAAVDRAERVLIDALPDMTVAQGEALDMLRGLALDTRSATVYSDDEINGFLLDLDVDCNRVPGSLDLAAAVGKVREFLHRPDRETRT